MGVIVDSGIQKEIDQLDAKGAFSLADTFRQSNQISLESLAFMTNVPPEYQALVTSSSAYQAVRAQREEKAKENEQDQKRTAERAAFQRQLDENMLRFTFDGQDIQISQGELRKEMKRRVEELEEQKRELQRNGGSPEQIQKVDALLDAYKPVMKDGENKPLDPDEIKNLMKQDPTFANRVEHHPAPATADTFVSGNMRTSFSNEVFNDGGIKTTPLTATFTNSASPTSTPSAPTSAPTVEKPQQNLNNVLQSAGF